MEFSTVVCTCTVLNCTTVHDWTNWSCETKQFFNVRVSLLGMMNRILTLVRCGHGLTDGARIFVLHLRIGVTYPENSWIIPCMTNLSLCQRSTPAVSFCCGYNRCVKMDRLQTSHSIHSSYRNETTAYFSHCVSIHILVTIGILGQFSMCILTNSITNVNSKGILANFWNDAWLWNSREKKWHH